MVEMLRFGDRSGKYALSEGSHKEACNGGCVHDSRVVDV